MKKRSVILSAFMILVFIFSGCSAIQKLNYKNKDFEFVNKNKLQKVVIQGTRDKGFRFLVKDEKTLENLYNSLSAATPVKEKSELEADYIFEFHGNDNTVRKYYYVAGVGDEENRGNFYDDKHTWYVLNRIDNEIIKNLLVLRKPTSFTTGYYGGIINLVKRVKQDYPDKGIAVMISEDNEMMKYHLSYEIMEFKRQLQEMGVELVRKNTDADVVISIRTMGYNSSVIKLGALVRDNVIRKEKSYYMKSDYKDREWIPKVFENKPEDF